MHVHLRLLGTPYLQAVAPLHLERRIATLLALLTIEGPTPRARVAGLLWPHAGEGGARANLRQMLMRLRSFTEEPLVTGRELLALAPEVPVDVRSLRAAWQEDARAGELDEELLGTLGGELLAGVDLDEAPDAMDWLEHARVEVRRLQHEVLRMGVQRGESRGDLPGALAFASRWVETMPESEEAHRQLMRLLFLSGDRGAALAAFERCRRTLRTQLDVAPLPETVELAREIERAPRHTPPPAPPVSIPLTVLRPPLLAGRAREWRQMEEAWAAGRVIVLRGEPGVGKTRLAHDFLASKGTFLRAGARPGDRNVPFATLTRAWRRLLVANPGVALEPWVREELARLMPELHPDAPPAPLAGSASQLRLYEACARFLRATRGTFVSQHFDDLQSMDRATFELGQFVVGRFGREDGDGPPPRLLVCYRTGELPAEREDALRELAAAGLASLIDVRPLTPDAVGALLASVEVSGAEALGPQLSRFSGGNPLFVLETLKLLLESGSPTLRWPERMPLPERVGQLVQQRLARLSPEALQLARVAAVASGEFEPSLAETVLGLSAAALAGPWAELEQAQVLRDGRFTHDVLLECVAAGTPESVRRHLHARVAEALGARGTSPAVVAWQWVQARDAARAIPFLLEAGRAAQAALRPEAAGFFTQAAELLERGGEPARAEEVRRLAQSPAPRPPPRAASARRPGGVGGPPAD